MNYRRIFIIYSALMLMSTLMWIGCNSAKENLDGVINVHSTIYGMNAKSAKNPLHIEHKIYFHDNQSIQEVPLLKFKEDSTGNKTDVVIKHYSYLDIKKNVGLKFLNFADTATVIKKYSDIDSVQVDGGWNFSSKASFEYTKSSKLNDTVVNNIQFGRVRLDKVVNGQNLYFILYLRCDQPELQIKLYKPLSDSIGCPIVRTDSYIKDTLFMTRELEFISDKLTEKQLQIFTSWKKKSNQ
jgi:hypothetical protein